MYKKQSLECTIYSLGFIATNALIWIGFVVGTSTSLLIVSEGYRNIYQSNGSTIMYTLVVAVVIITAYVFYKGEYEGWKNNELTMKNLE